MSSRWPWSSRGHTRASARRSAFSMRSAAAGAGALRARLTPPGPIPFPRVQEYHGARFPICPLPGEPMPNHATRIALALAAAFALAAGSAAAADPPWKKKDKKDDKKDSGGPCHIGEGI